MAKKSNNEHMTKGQMRRRKRKKWLIIEIIILVVLLAGIYIVSKFGMISFNNISDVETNELDSATKEMLSGYTNIALFGVDNRTMGNYDSGNSDSIMIASINNDTKEVRIVSVYRDTFMEVDGEGKYRKCNYAYNSGGAKEAIEMLNRNLDLDIEEYVSVDFQALTDAIDALGGVELTIEDEEELYWVNLYLDEVNRITGGNSPHIESVGTSLFDGAQATAYCRNRKGSTNSDLKRASRQRIVIEKVIEKVKEASLSDLNNLIDAVFPEIATSLSVSQIVSMAASLQSYELAETAAYPFNMYLDQLGKPYGDVDTPCTVVSNVTTLQEFFFENEEYTPSDTLQDISDYIEDFTGHGESDGLVYNSTVGDETGDLSTDAEDSAEDDTEEE